MHMAKMSRVVVIRTSILYVRFAAKLIHSPPNILKPPCCATDLVKSGKTDIAKAAGFRPWPVDEAVAVKQNYGQRLKAAFEALKLAPDQD
jgi:3-hydroxybutyryl-CoA dehydrogenase